MPDIQFTAAAIDDLRRVGPDAVPKVLKKVLLLEENPEAGHPLGGELTGFRKLVVGRNTWRIVYRVDDNKNICICEVWAVGARSDAEVYAEATARVNSAQRLKPELVELSKVIEQLGRLTGDAVVEKKASRQPVPDWLSERLIFTAGMRPEEVAALDLEEAVDLWTAFISRST